MTHEEAWSRLPDLLSDRDDGVLLGHVNACHACQRQLFKLSRVDRILRSAGPRTRRLPFPWHISGALIAAVAAAMIILLVPVWQHHLPAHVLHNATGTSVGRATLSRSDAENLAVSLELHGVKMAGGDVYVLWTRSTESPRPVPVGRFMVNSSGSCRARFTLPAGSRWTQFWVTPPTHPALVLATT